MSVKYWAKKSSDIQCTKCDPGYVKKKKVGKIFTTINGVYLVVFISLG